MSKYPSNCDFCSAETETKKLAAWSCASFEMIMAVKDRTLYTVCTCHTLDLLPPDATIVEQRNYIGAWVGCPACRADIDAGRWLAVARRSRDVTVQKARRSGNQPPPNLAEMTAQIHELFLTHASSPDEGTWQPATDALVDAEIALYNAQRGRPD